MKRQKHVPWAAGQLNNNTVDSTHPSIFHSPHVMDLIASSEEWTNFKTQRSCFVSALDYCYISCLGSGPPVDSETSEQSQELKYSPPGSPGCPDSLWHHRLASHWEPSSPLLSANHLPWGIGLNIVSRHERRAQKNCGELKLNVLAAVYKKCWCSWRRREKTSNIL